MGAHIIKRIAVSLGLMSNVYNGLGQGEIVEDKLVDSEDEVDAAKARRARDENEGSPRRRSNMSFTNRLRVMDDRLGDINSNIYRLSNEVEELTKVVSGMSEQYDPFYDIPDLGVQQGVNFTSSPQTYSTAPFATPADPFGLFGSLGDSPSTSQRPGNDMDED
ncbi:hypothetical protein Tco_1506829 [Tanacetum coccineum]